MSCYELNQCAGEVEKITLFCSKSILDIVYQILSELAKFRIRYGKNILAYFFWDAVYMCALCSWWCCGNCSWRHRWAKLHSSTASKKTRLGQGRHRQVGFHSYALSYHAFLSLWFSRDLPLSSDGPNIVWFLIWISSVHFQTTSALPHYRQEAWIVQTLMVFSSLSFLTFASNRPDAFLLISACRLGGGQKRHPAPRNMQ